MPPDTLLLGLRVTLDDQLHFNEWLLDRPELRRKRLLVRGLILVLVPPLGILLGIATATLQDGGAFWPALRDAAGDRGTQFIAGTVCGLMVLLWAGTRLLRRPLLRRRLRRLLPERPGIDPAVPTLAEPVQVSVGPDGFLSEAAATTVRVAWAAVKELADTGTVLVVRTGRHSGFLIPKRDLSEAQTAALRGIVEAHTRR